VTESTAPPWLALASRSRFKERFDGEGKMEMIRKVGTEMGWEKRDVSRERERKRLRGDS
jgi:hypothetical protein